MWLSVQPLTDAKDKEDARLVLENAAHLFLFKHKGTSEEFVKKVTGMSDSQFATLCDLGGDPDSQARKNRKGECGLSMGKHNFFIKVCYKKEVEGMYIETDAEERTRLYKKFHGITA